MVSLDLRNHFKKINQLDFKPQIFSPSINYALQTLDLEPEQDPVRKENTIQPQVSKQTKLNKVLDKPN